MMVRMESLRVRVRVRVGAGVGVGARVRVRVRSLRGTARARHACRRMRAGVA